MMLVVGMDHWAEAGRTAAKSRSKGRSRGGFIEREDSGGGERRARVERGNDPQEKKRRPGGLREKVGWRGEAIQKNDLELAGKI